MGDMGICLIMIIPAMLVAVFTEVFIHEIGHLLAGKKIGYSTLFMGFYGIYFEKKVDRTIIRYHGGEPRGQCIMRPRDIELPAGMYILGGIIAQTVVSGVALLICIALGLYLVVRGFTRNYAIALVWAMVICLINMFGALLNYFNSNPYSDGVVFREIKKNPVANILYNQVMEINYLSYMGMSFLEMPDELFDVRGAEKTNLGKEIELYRYYRLMENAPLDDKREDDLKRLSHIVAESDMVDDVKQEENILALIKGNEIMHAQTLNCSDSRTGLGLALIGMNTATPVNALKDEAEKSLYPGEWLTAIRTFEKAVGNES